MRIGQLGGEFALIERIAARVAAGPMGAVPVGIGDDAAVLSPELDGVLVTTDLLIEGRHFRRSWGVPPHLLGAKAVAVNLSDIAAMGGCPTGTFVSLALPDDADVAFVDGLYEGMVTACALYGSVLAGGDTNTSPGPLVISITQTGGVGRGGPLLRSGARPGDRVIVTGTLGGSAAGLAALERSGYAAAVGAHPDAVAAHLEPTPRLLEATAALGVGGVTAGMDLSDGLLGDLAKLCRASGVGASVDVSALPLPEFLRADAAALGADPEAWALRGGEDYELLLTVAPDAAERVIAAILEETGTPATVIGVITDGEGVTIPGDGNLDAVSVAGWDHFSHA